MRAAIAIALLLCAGAVAAGASMVLHSSGGCALYAVTSGGNLHIGCKGDSTMPKGAK